MHKNAMKCNKTQSKWCINKYGASKIIDTFETYQLLSCMKQKHSIQTPVCPQERLVIISFTTGLSFALERIGPLAAIIIIVFYLLVLYLSALPNTPENQFPSIYSESLIKTACQHLLLLIGFNTLIY
jgi:hypothetical protein